MTNTLELEVQHVSKRFPDGTYALQDMDWGVQQGETMALIGESGSGKTTLLRLLNRLAEPSSGEVFIQGFPATSQDPIALRRRLGYVPQDGGLFPHDHPTQRVFGASIIRMADCATIRTPRYFTSPCQFRSNTDRRPVSY